MVKIMSIFSKNRISKLLKIRGVNIKFIPAGHILGSSQIYLEYKGEIIIVSGDYKRRKDLTCDFLKLVNVILLLLKLLLVYLYFLTLMILMKHQS